MKASRLISRFVTAVILTLALPLVAIAAEKVRVFNFARAETDNYMATYVKQGALGKFVHIRQPTPIEKQDVIRMNRDTLYSIGCST
jgi:hypothetical protein